MASTTSSLRAEGRVQASPQPLLPHGQALVETLLVFPVMTLILVGLVLFTKLGVAKLAVEQAAWQGMLLVVTTDAGRSAVFRYLQEVLRELAPSVPPLAPQDLRFNPGHGWELPASLSFSLPMEQPVRIARVLGRRRIILTGSSTCYRGSWIFWNPRDPAFRLPGLAALRRTVLAGLGKQGWP